MKWTRSLTGRSCDVSRVLNTWGDESFFGRPFFDEVCVGAFEFGSTLQLYICGNKLTLKSIGGFASENVFLLRCVVAKGMMDRLVVRSSHPFVIMADLLMVVETLGACPTLTIWGNTLDKVRVQV